MGSAAIVMAALLALGGSAQAAPTVVTASNGSAVVAGSTPVPMDFPLGRAGDLGFDTWLQYETENGTAVATGDYTAARGAMQIPAGSSEGDVSVQARGKVGFEPDMQFALKLLSATGVGPTPSLAERATFAAGGSISARATVGDLNGDGRPDFIVPNAIPGTVSILLNTTSPGSTTPSLAAPQSFATGSGPEAATPTDVNGDARPDLVVTNSGDDTFSVLINNTAPGASTVSFDPPQVFEAGRGPREPVLEDINSDGRPDLVVVNDQFDEHAIAVFFNTTPPGASTVSFQPRQYFEFFGDNFVTPADVNGDGRPDFVISASAGVNELSVILNATPPGSSSLILGSEVDLPVGQLPNVVRAADLNGDGRLDLVVANNEGDSVSVLLNGTASGASTPSFPPQQTFAVGKTVRSLQAVDLNGDGKPDLAVGNEGNHSLSVLLNTTAPGAGSASFATTTFEAEPGPLGLAAADLNGDGRQDLIYTRFKGLAVVSLNTTASPTAAAPSFAVKHEADVGARPTAVATADFNGDGRPDVAVANHDSDTASVLLDDTAPGSETPTFHLQQAFAAGNAPSSIAAADFNLDGRPDLVVADELEEDVSVLLDTTVPGAETPSFATRQTFAVGEAPSAVAVADLNGDGKPDLIVANHDEETVSILLDTTLPGSTTVTFAPQKAFVSDHAPSALAIADFNLDGKLDFVAESHDGGSGSVFVNDTEPGSFTPNFKLEQVFGWGILPSAVMTGDFNGDGKPDLAIAGEGSDDVSVILDTTAPGASSPTFSLPQELAAGDAPTSIAAADVNGDGVPDLLVTNKGDGTVSAFLNETEPGAAAPEFGEQQTFAAGGGPQALTTADLNGDGGPDLISADGGADAVSALLDTQYAVSISPTSVTGTIHYAIPHLELTPSSIAFGGQALGSVTTRAVTVSNNGGADLAIGGIAISSVSGGGLSQTNNCPPTLAVGSSCSVDITFSPSVAGSTVAELTVNSIAPSGPDNVAISGSGVAATVPPPPPQPMRSLHIKSKGDGAGRVEDRGGTIFCPSICSHSFTQGTVVTLTATPASGSRFEGWSGGGCSGKGSCRVTVSSDSTVTAKFAKASVAAGLRISKASASTGGSGLRISARGAIAKGARGKVTVKVRIRVLGRWVTAARSVGIAGGAWGTQLVLRKTADLGTPIVLTVGFGGSSGFHSGQDERRLRVR